MTTAPPQQLLQRAVVKATLSGDTVILRGKPRPDGPPAERTLGLAGITAPRFGRRGETEDDPFAFESRNVLRKRLVGKEVFFRVDYAIPGSGREYGVVFIPAEGAPVPNTLESAQMFMIREGLARVREDNRKQAGARKDEVESPSCRGGDIDSLLILESQAKEAKKGIWGDKTEVANRQVLHQLQGEPRDLVDKYAGQKLDAIVEQVRDGSSYRVLLILENESVHQYVNLLPSGIKCPILRSGIPDQDDVVEPYAEEAKFFVETRLLQRDVKVILEGVSGSSNVVGSVLHPKGNIAEFLLSAGLARVQDWSCPLVTGGAAPLREAEKDAKDKKLKIWRNYVAKPTAKGSVGLAGKDFEAIVSRIVSGDTVMVRSETSEEKKVQLSSIRQPKQKTFHNEEAREFLRRRLIGKTVRVTMDYTKPASDGYEAKDCATIRVGGGPDRGVNIAEAIVERGLASVIRHRRDDDDRSSDYDKLLVAEAKAQKELKGIHSTKEAPPHIEPRDASESAAKAKQLLSFLQRAGRIPAVVEHVANGSRFKVFVPRENAKMTLVFAGIRAPKAARNSSEQSEPYGAEALQYSSRKALQRDVEIEIENVDKTGGFIGSIWLSKTENLAVKLLEEGLATVHEYSASQSTYANQLFAAENLAKAARKNIWANYDEAEENARLQQEETAVAEPTKPNKEYLDVVVSEILDKGGFFVQVVNEGIHSLERLMSEFGVYHTTAAGNPSYRPKNGEVCSAQFTQDDAWYRAKVRRQAPEKGGVEVVYVDYGNSEVVNFSRVRPLPQQFCALPYQSHEATLAYVKVPGQETDYGYEAECRFREMVQGKQLVANVEVRIGGIMHLTLYDPSVSKDPNATLNAQLVADGYATVNRKFGYAKANPGMVNFLGECQQRAKKSRVGMWEYGDITEEEEEVERKPSVWRK